MVAITDINAQELNNCIKDLSMFKVKNELLEVILLTAHGNIPDGVQAIKNGAFDYITKGDDIPSSNFGRMKLMSPSK